jgi:uncharacterized membrane protein YeaQ/YmgE (transglycosylase-associated protein family)
MMAPALAIGSVVLEPGGLFSWLIVGLLAGWLAGKVVEGRGLGCLTDIIVGVVGAFVGGFVFRLIGGSGAFGFWGSILIAFIGAVILLVLLRAVSGRRT